MAGQIGKRIYASRAWTIIRSEVFARDEYRCVRCGKGGRLECDHIVPVSKGGSQFDKENLRTLCRGCHVEITARQNRKPPSPDRAAWDVLVEAL